MIAYKEIDDPSEATTISEFITAGKQVNTITNPLLRFTETSNNIVYTVKDTIDDYMYDLRKAAINCKLTRDQIIKYKYNPKKLAYDIYGSTDLFYVILKINYMASIKEFNLSTGYIYMLSKTDMTNYLNAIYKNEKADIKAYNSLHN